MRKTALYLHKRALYLRKRNKTRIYTKEPWHAKTQVIGNDLFGEASFSSCEMNVVKVCCSALQCVAVGDPQRLV